MLCKVTSAKHAVLYEVTSAKHAVLYEVTSAKHACLSLEKIWMGQMGRLEEKIAGALLYQLHSFLLACLIFSWFQSVLCNYLIF
jgi:hypothetical protein